VDYFFITPDEFKTKIRENAWAEWAEVYGHYYGTSAGFIDRHLSQGHDILLDIDVNGTRQILSRYPESITIFIMPPTLETLRQRLIQRGTDSETVVARRLENAVSEMAGKDMYQHIVVNDALPQAIQSLCAIISENRAG
jgi:guanylate kinase